jgi:Ca2+-binding EF-hand superfamily protein
MDRPRIHVDWKGLFLKYDTNKNNYMEWPEIGKMMKDAGFTEATNSEIQFTFNVINKFRGRLDSGTFVSWGQSMQDKLPLQLMYYGQYLETNKAYQALDRHDRASRIAL